MPFNSLHNIIFSDAKYNIYGVQINYINIKNKKSPPYPGGLKIIRKLIKELFIFYKKTPLFKKPSVSGGLTKPYQ